MFRPLLAVVLVIHSLIHLMGVAKAFGWARLPQLTLPFSRPAGLLWALAAVLCGAAAIMLFAAPRIWWMVGAAALVVSQGAIATAWADARFGTVANVILLAGVAFGYLHDGPRGFDATYARDATAVLAGNGPDTLLTEADLAALPPLVQRYVRQSGAVGQPRVRNFRVHFRGQIRSGPRARWMAFTGEQVNGIAPPSRLFLMDGSLLGVPFQAFHRFVGAAATMQVKVAALVPMVDARGPAMNEAETVTLLNDLCVFAPGGLPHAGLHWEPLDSLRVRATFRNAGQTVHAVLQFSEGGELVNFFSDDRGAISADGRTVTKMRWSTPVKAYATFGGHRLTTGGEGVWDAPDGEYSYIRLEVISVEYNVRR